MPYSDYPQGSIAARGEEIYYHQLREKVESKHKGKFLTQNPRNRVIAQKSIFLRHPDGFLNPDNVAIITIPARLKQPLLTYLQKYHDISTDLIADEAESFEEKQTEYEKAVSHYTRALVLA